MSQPVSVDTKWTPPASASLRILIVDDSPEIVETLSMLLGLSGNTTFAARDGEEALSVAETVRPDLILLDLMLPKMDGFAVCHRIRQQAWGEGMIIVALTGLGHDEARTNTMQFGFDMHLVKPVDPENLFSLLASLGLVTATK